MARDGIPVPAQSARVDFFNPVLADIGDIQSVGGDLSTFSGHMLVCREVLASSGKRALVLMDELGSGTDPSQGVAIAQALLEALVENGSRIVITTHNMALKQLAAADDRFSVAAVQFSNVRLTYSLLTGAIGESFTLSVAKRLNLPSFVIQRANELLDHDTRRMGELITKLEEQRAVVDQQQVEDLARRQQEIESLQLGMERAQSKLVQQQLNAIRFWGGIQTWQLVPIGGRLCSWFMLANFDGGDSYYLCYCGFSSRFCVHGSLVSAVRRVLL